MVTFPFSLKVTSKESFYNYMKYKDKFTTDSFLEIFLGE